MYTYSVNVSIDGRHYFLIENIDGHARADSIARDMMLLYTQQGFNVKVSVTKWSKPLGETVLELN